MYKKNIMDIIKPNMNNVFTNIFDRVYIINLEDRIDRKIKMIHKFEEINTKYQFIKAIDTRNSSKELNDLIERSDYRKIGEIGYKKTYQKIIFDAIEKKYDTIVCFDDDAILCKEFHNKFNKKMKSIPNNWEILYLGASEWSKKDLDNFKGEYYYPTLEYDSVYGDGTCGSYAIAFKRSFLLKFANYLTKFDNAFDRILINYIKEHAMKNVYVMYPNLVIADITDSDIRPNYRSMKDHCKIVHWNLDNFEFPFSKERYGPIITAAIITKNRSKLLKKCLNSIFLQKMIVNGLEKDFTDLEICIINDGSTDDTEEMIKNYIKLNTTRKIVYKKTKGEGIPIARNKVNQLASGVYIAVVDDDDIQLPFRLYNHIKSINMTYDNEIGSYGGWINYDLRTKEMQVNPGRYRSFNTIAFIGSVLIHPATCYRKDIITKFIYNEMYPFNSDYDVAIRLAHEKKVMTHCEDYLIIRLIHGDNVSCFHNKEQLNYAKMSRDSLFALYTVDDIIRMMGEAIQEVINNPVTFDKEKNIKKDDIEKLIIC